MFGSHYPMGGKSAFPHSFRRGRIAGMEDFLDYARRRQNRAPLEAGGAFLFGFAVAAILPINVEPIEFGMAVGLAVAIVEIAHLGWRAMADSLQKLRQREDDEWNRAVNAGFGNSKAPPGSN